MPDPEVDRELRRSLGPDQLEQEGIPLEDEVEEVRVSGPVLCADGITRYLTLRNPPEHGYRWMPPGPGPKPNRLNPLDDDEEEDGLQL